MVQEFLTAYLRCHPYRICLQHELSEDDFIRKLYKMVSPSVCKSMASDDKLGSQCEAAFPLNGKVNTWNAREYASVGSTPNFNYNVRTSHQDITEWGGFPFFFDNVNGTSYLDMLNKENVPTLALLFSGQFSYMNACKSFGGFKDNHLREVKQCLEEVFQNRVIAVNHEME